MTKTDFEYETLRLKGLLLEALIRLLEEDKAGESRMAAAELSSAVNFLKANAVEAPVTSFNRVFEDDEQ